MKWSFVLCSVEENKGVLCLEDDEVFIKVPLRCLPKGYRVGDVFEVDISFSPFKTLGHIENSKKRNSNS